jgi:hypothetical protein
MILAPLAVLLAEAPWLDLITPGMPTTPANGIGDRLKKSNNLCLMGSHTLVLIWVLNAFYFLP